MVMSSDLPFLSTDNQTYDKHSFSRDNFKAPKLSRFSFNEYHILKCISWGADGVVYSASFDGQKQVALKIFHHNHRREEGQPYTIDSKGLVTEYWAFERECINAGLLKMIAASIEHSKSSGEPIYLKKDPTTREDAVNNLEAFSDEGRLLKEDFQEGDLMAFKSNAKITDCLGWVEFDPTSFENATAWVDHGIRLGQRPDPGPIFGIVYEWVSTEKLEKEIARSQLEFFHITGFSMRWFYPQNWLGNGILVDFSDIIPPFEGLGWDDAEYRLYRKSCIGEMEEYLDSQ
ncbi:hypothetical protein F5B20DRAFT_562058 [Whalleya microplaca]|nr:hypothetical protein F5B20DRAFT_562058 [Whalleya microplaca]